MWLYPEARDPGGCSPLALQKGCDRHGWASPSASDSRLSGCFSLMLIDSAGLESTPYLTNASLFNLTELPPRLVVLGAGPISLEMAQAFQRFGSEVTVLEVAPEIMGAEDDEAATLIREVLQAEGVKHLGPKGARSWPQGFTPAARCLRCHIRRRRSLRRCG